MNRAITVCALALAGVVMLAGASSASAAPPKCHGKTATLWSKKGFHQTVEGTDGPDVIVTGPGDDTINGNKGWDVICSHGGNDTVQGGSGTDRIYSGSGDDFASGATGDDVICAYGGRDGVFGGQGDDWLSVGSGVNYYDADGSGNLEDSMYKQWISDGYTYTVGIGGGGDDVMTGGMTHVKGAKLDKRWYC
jgi:Ca2+-binding RTX toxin-like protein